jgi:hypothetical protein
MTSALDGRSGVNDDRVHLGRRENRRVPCDEIGDVRAIGDLEPAGRWHADISGLRRVLLEVHGSYSNPANV